MSEIPTTIFFGERTNTITNSFQSDNSIDKTNMKFECSDDSFKVGISEKSDPALKIEFDRTEFIPHRGSTASSLSVASSVTLYQTPAASLSSKTVQSSLCSARPPQDFSGGHGVCCNFGTKSPDLDYRPPPRHIAITAARVHYFNQPQPPAKECTWWAFIKRMLRQRPPKYVEYKARKQRKRLAAPRRAMLEELRSRSRWEEADRYR